MLTLHNAPDSHLGIRRLCHSCIRWCCQRFLLGQIYDYCSTFYCLLRRLELIGQCVSLVWRQTLAVFSNTPTQVTAIPGVTGEPPHWWGACVSLVLVAIGTGGIKSAVSSFVGDQFSKGQESMMTTVYSLFYFMINSTKYTATCTCEL